MNEIDYCESKLWDSKLTWHTNTPDLTECFKKTILVLTPCSFLWIFLPLEVHFLRKSETRDIPFNHLNVIKLILAFLGVCLTFVDFVHDVSILGFQVIIDLYYSPIILCLTRILFFILIITNIKRGIRSSGILFTYSFLSVICGIPEIYTIIKNEFPIFLRNDKEVENLSYILYYITLTLVLILNCFADEIPQRSLCLTSKNTYPYKDVSFLSKLFMTWFDAYVWKNYQNPVKQILWDLDSEDMAENIATREAMHRIKKYNKDKKIKREEFSILKALFEEYGRTFLLCALIRTTFEVMTVGLYITTDWLISGLELKEEAWKEYVYVSFYFIVIMSQTLVYNKYWEICHRLNVKVRTSSMSYLYKKALLISNAVRMEYTTSDIVNLISLDTFQLQSSIEQFHFLFALCIQVIAAYIYLCFLLGPSAMISMIFIIFIFIFNYRTISKMKRLQQEEMKNKDKRGKFMQEIFSGIKVLKMYAWESSFKKVAMYLRSEENKTLKKIANVNIILNTIFQNCPFWVTMVTYLCYAFATHEEMNVRITFVSLVVFNSLRVAFHHIPTTILYVQQVLVSIKRMNKFLNSEELDEHSISHESTDERLIMQNATFSWISKNGPNSLENLNIKINDSKLVGIVGPVGAGKSSLISAFLGEMYKISGYVNTRGSIAYVPQQAWILNTTVKENITLGEHVDKELYEKAIQSCALQTDLESFSAGDLTEIGEKGINLSGGQKQRISLARAVCRSADIYFFDDPLSAVDTHVANHIFTNVLGSSGILNEKVRILVTHNAKFFPLMDEIIVLKNGYISEIGTYQQLMDEGGEFSEFLNSIHECNSEKKEELNGNSDKVGLNENEQENGNNYIRSRFEHKQKSLHKIIQEEETKIKRINKKTYWMYIKAGGIYMWLVVSVSFLLFQTFNIMSSIWLSNWINSVDNYLNRYFYLSIYTGFGIVQIGLIAISLTIFLRSSVKAGQYFYQRLLDCVIQWPMSSFDATPIGRIIKRFSDDIYMIDNHIAVRWASFFTVFSRYFATVIFSSVYVPMSTFTTIPLIISLYILRVHYASFHHQLKRIETKEKSPLYSHLVETISGIQSIRAFCFQNKFIHRCYKKIDSYSTAYHASITCERWFCSRVELLENLFLCSITTFLIFEQDHYDIGMMSVIIVFGIQVIRGIAYLFSVFSGIEDGIISLEQINEYFTYPEEPFSRKSSVEISKTWPSRGEVIFDNVKLRYRDGLDFVLDGLSFIIKSEEKIGIVGRTGAGKSSIIVALFRLVEPAGGRVLIDGVDISKVNLHELRSKIAVIPQDPILFSGTLRFNLDPFNEYQDDLLWDILEKSHLKTFVSSLPAGLLYGIEEGGQNLSFGQRQLICLARALLRKSKILVLDEATASVDLTTDELIQNTIQQEFSNSTVITIAHRLNTLKGYDKILMLEGGRIIKFDKPENLLH